MSNVDVRLSFGALALTPGGSGVQTYCRELMVAMAAAHPGWDLSAVVSESAVRELPATISPRRRPPASGFARAVLGALPVFDGDLFHSLDVDLPVWAPRDVTQVATVHDLSVFDTPWAHGKVRAAGERQLVRHALRHADVVIAVSNFTADRIRSRFGREAVVTPLAPGAWAQPATPEQIEAVRTRYVLPDNFVLQVGTVEPRKAVDVVARGCELAGVPCVLAGAGSLGPSAPTGTMGLGYVDLADLPALYGAATVTAYASRYEGFGLPPLEAMACGGAVVTSAVGDLGRHAKGGAVVLDTLDPAVWAAAFAEIMTDDAQQAELRTLGRTTATKLTWARTAAATTAAYGHDCGTGSTGTLR